MHIHFSAATVSSAFRVKSPVMRAVLQAMLDGNDTQHTIDGVADTDMDYANEIFDITGAIELLDDQMCGLTVMPGELRTVLPADAEWLHATRDRD